MKKKTALSKEKNYKTDSGLGGVFTLEYLGFYNDFHNFKSTSWFNKGHEYQIKEENLNTFLKQ